MKVRGKPAVLDPVLVTWADHTFHYGPYRPSKGFTTWESVGFLIELGDERVVVAQSLDGTEPHEWLCLLRTDVLELRRLK